MLLFPVHLPGHWVLIVVDGRAGREYVGVRDSCSKSVGPTEDGQAVEAAKYIRDWLSCGAGDIAAGAGAGTPHRFDSVRSWPIVAIGGPLQTNGDDCGVHVLVAAEGIVLSDPQTGAAGYTLDYVGTSDTMDRARYSMHAWMLQDA